jgi:hypothetical protein
MAQVILNIKNFRFIKVEKTIITDEPSKEEVIENIKRGLKDLTNIEQGKCRSRSAKDFLNEL